MYFRVLLVFTGGKIEGFFPKYTRLAMLALKAYVEYS